MKTILGTGIFNLDKIYVREYPLGPSHNRTFNETFLKEEAGGTCGNIMCMLAHYGWKTYPLAKLDNSADGHTLAGSLKSFGCDCRFVSNSDDGGTNRARPATASTINAINLPTNALIFSITFMLLPSFLIHNNRQSRQRRCPLLLSYQIFMPISIALQ